MTIDEMVQKEQAMAAEWVVVATNSGTYSTHDAVSNVGCADPAFSDRVVYEQVGTGVRQSEGPSKAKAPGRMREFLNTLFAKRAELADLRRRIEAAQSAR